LTEAPLFRVEIEIFLQKSKITTLAPGVGGEESSEQGRAEGREGEERCHPGAYPTKQTLFFPILHLQVSFLKLTLKTCPDR
jgi:hypothetical protein